MKQPLKGSNNPTPLSPGKDIPALDLSSKARKMTNISSGPDGIGNGITSRAGRMEGFYCDECINVVWDGTGWSEFMGVTPWSK